MNISAILQLIYISSIHRIRFQAGMPSKVYQPFVPIPLGTKSKIFKTMKNPVRISTVCVGHPVVASATAAGC